MNFMTNRSRFFLSSALGAIAIHVLFVACSSPTAPVSATDSGVMNMIRDVMNIEIPDASAQPLQPATFFARQTEGVDSNTDFNWVDVPGLAVNFTVPQGATNTDVLITGQAYALTGGSNPWALCGYRLVLDASPVGPENAGARNVAVRGEVIGMSSSFAFMDRFGLAPGPHTLRLQTARINIGGPSTPNPASGNATCRTPASMTQMHVTVR
jgi:hypothetical protein